MKIIPSLVELSPTYLFDRITFLSPYYSHFQIDIEDGKFIENKTLSTQEFVDYCLNGYNQTKLIKFDFHLMEIGFERSIELLSQIKNLIQIDTILLHTKLHPKLHELQQKYPSFHIGIVINPEENVDIVAQEFSLKSVPAVQLMTVFPGKQGQSFIPESLKKIERLKKRGYSGPIFIDGAVNEMSFPLLKQILTNSDILCPGSYLAKAPKEDLERRVKFLSTE